MFDTERVFMQAWDYAGEKIGVGPAGYMSLKTLGMNIAMTKSAWRETGELLCGGGFEKWTAFSVQGRL